MRAIKILDCDIENRPLSYLGPDYTTGEVTAIAAGWAHEKRVFCWALGEVTTKEMLSAFRQLYDEADIVTGHYILKHDLPILNASMVEFNLGPLSPKRVSDTKIHSTKTRYLSMSQESLCEMFGISLDKYHMTQPKWREANRLTQRGIRETRKRVIGDVRQHRELRREMVERGLLKSPTIWRP